VTIFEFTDLWPESYKISENQTKKWMRLAKAVQDSEKPCYSKQIGVVVVDPVTNSLVSSGHNGPPQGCLPNDHPDYLRKVVYPLLTPAESLPLGNEDDFVEENANCQVCPRRLVGARRGQRLELCTCIHGEVDAITRANRSVAGCYMFAYCGVPCVDCTKVTINAGIDTVVALNNRAVDYSPYSSRWLFEQSKVKLILVPEEWIWN